MRKNIFIFTVIIFLSICASVFIFPRSENPHFLSAFAQEDEDDGYESDQNDDEARKKAKSERIGRNQRQDTVSPRVIAETVSESAQAVSLAASSVISESPVEKRIFPRDTDGDGLYDDQDPHPGIHEKKIVRDDNRNGIVDAYE